MNKISERIREALQIRNMKQADLVEKTGIGKSSISTYISGEYEPKRKNIYKIAKALNVNEAWLMGLDVSMEREQIISNFTPDMLKNEKLLNDVLLKEAEPILSNVTIKDNNNNIVNVSDLLNKEKNNYELKALIYNQLFDHLVYNKSENTLDIYPYIDKNAIKFNDIEKMLINKYRRLDDKGKHTVETVMEMEYTRCKDIK